ncbi:MAG: radical SAM family heme chaperone HemW [Bacteroidales bacterium]|nr:radical SAM family heme chaperone HemW [Bacteroidales bacterium]
MAGIYLHIPFCRKKCMYCDFYSLARISESDKFVDALLQEIENEKYFLADAEINTIYFGGGSPSVLSISQIQKIIEKLDQNFNTSNVKEFSFELNPDDAEIDYLRELKNLGINRLSVGVQSTHDRHLKFLSRKHNSATAINAIENAQKIGLENISADLMFGIPNLTTQELAESIKTVVESGILHLSIYLLTAEEQTILLRKIHEGKVSLPDDNTSILQYNLICEHTREFGFEHYEISNFSKKGFRSMHNSSYWKGDAYLGLGPSAHSYDGQKTRRANFSNLKDYINKINKKEISYTSEKLSDTDLINEFIMTRLRTWEGINLNEFQNKFGKKHFDKLNISAQKLINQNLLKAKENFLFIPENQMLISDNIISSLFQ